MILISIMSLVLTDHFKIMSLIFLSQRQFCYDSSQQNFLNVHISIQQSIWFLSGKENYEFIQYFQCPPPTIQSNGLIKLVDVFYLLKHREENHLQITCAHHTFRTCVNADMYVTTKSWLVFQNKNTICMLPLKMCSFSEGKKTRHQ